MATKYKDPRTGEVYSKRPQRPFLKSGLATKYLIPFDSSLQIQEVVRPVNKVQIVAEPADKIQKVGRGKRTKKTI